jgi:HPt (histidine-containing phosphotransfer) domain-containing protein
MKPDSASWPGAAEALNSPSQPVDLAHLSRYTLGERALELEVLELFSTQSLVYLERLRGAPTDKDWHEAAHSLKGSAVAIGAWRVANAAERAESAIATSWQASIEEIESSLREALGFIDAFLARRGVESAVGAGVSGPIAL